MTDIKEYIKEIEFQNNEINNLKRRLDYLEKIIFKKNSRNAGRNQIFNDKDKAEIKKRYAELNSSRKVAEEFGVSKGTILNIIKE